jgi:hypothetical protein
VSKNEEPVQIALQSRGEPFILPFGWRWQQSGSGRKRPAYMPGNTRFEALLERSRDAGLGASVGKFGAFQV